MLYVYLSLADLRQGRHRLGLEIRNMESGVSLVRMEQPIDSPGPLEVIEVVIALRGVPIQEPGSIELVLLHEHTPVSSRVLAVQGMENS